MVRVNCFRDWIDNGSTQLNQVYHLTEEILTRLETACVLRASVLDFLIRDQSHRIGSIQTARQFDQRRILLKYCGDDFVHFD